MKSQLFSLKTRDVIKGLVVAVITAVLMSVQQALTDGGKIDLKQTAVVAGIAGASYLLKNFCTDDVKEAQKTISEAKQKAEMGNG